MRFSYGQSVNLSDDTGDLLGNKFRRNITVNAGDVQAVDVGGCAVECSGKLGELFGSNCVGVHNVLLNPRASPAKLTGKARGGLGELVR